ncbi:MAG: hypothetical protein IT308_05490 [Anaerolineaceae bacterium]|nr:hypothetical protein [Anaerolineaceae bacterium]
MVTAIDILQLVVGLALFLLGGSFIQGSPRIGGFLVGGLAAAEVVVRVAALTALWQWLGPLLAFVAGGLIGMLLGSILSMLLLVLYTSILGAMVGFIMGFLVAVGGSSYHLVDSLIAFSEVTPVQSAFMVVFALLFGFMSLRFQDFMAMASTAFIGSGLAIFTMADQLKTLSPIFKEDVVLLFAWVVIGLIGLMAQNSRATR